MTGLTLRPSIWTDGDEGLVILAAGKRPAAGWGRWLAGFPASWFRGLFELIDLVLQGVDVRRSGPRCSRRACPNEACSASIYQTDDLDASLLLLLLMVFLPPSDKRMQDTVVAIADELTEDDLVLRYRVKGTDIRARR